MPRPQVWLAVALSWVACKEPEQERATQRGVAGQPQRGSPPLLPGPPAPPEIPDGPPFVGEAGTDTHGYPLRRPDGTVLVALLRARRFSDLDAAFEHYQKEYEADFRKERWPYQAMRSFEVRDESLGPLLDEWVKASPESFAPYAARGAWYDARGWKIRGHDTVGKTLDVQLDALTRELDKAAADFARAGELRSGLLAADLGLMWVANTLGDRVGLAAAYADAKKKCDTCFMPRYARMVNLQPRWGGSYPQMEAEADVGKAALAANPALSVLAGFPASDRCGTLWQDGQIDDALVECDRALKVGTHPDFACKKGRILAQQKRYADALGPLDDALRLDPQSYDCLRARSFARAQTKDYVGAAEDLLVLRRLDPSDDEMNPHVDWMLQRLRYDARQAHEKGNPRQEAKLRALGNAIKPGGGDPVAAGGATADQLVQLREQVSAAPDDFELRRKLDQALAARGKFDEIVKMWDAFLDTHPRHGGALRERAGAKWHADDRDGAIADSDAACSAGDPESCSIAKQMRARAGR